MNTQSVPFVAIPFKDGVFRVWIDMKGKPYKREIRSDRYMCYHNIEVSPKAVTRLAGFRA